MLIDDKVISKEASFTAQQSLGRVKFFYPLGERFKFVFKQRFCVLYNKIDLL